MQGKKVLILDSDYVTTNSELLLEYGSSIRIVLRRLEDKNLNICSIERNRHKNIINLAREVNTISF